MRMLLIFLLLPDRVESIREAFGSVMEKRSGDVPGSR
jgi:hypothetical protein